MLVGGVQLSWLPDFSRVVPCWNWIICPCRSCTASSYAIVSFHHWNSLFFIVTTLEKISFLWSFLRQLKDIYFTSFLLRTTSYRLAIFLIVRLCVLCHLKRFKNWFFSIYKYFLDSFYSIFFFWRYKRYRFYDYS